MEDKFAKEELYRRAEKRVKDITGFYWHLFWYLAVNIYLTFGGPIWAFVSGGSVELHSLNYGNFSVWFFWGIGIVGHWLHVFGRNIFFSKDWEDRKIKEFMDKDKFDN